jgi:zinc transport system permease protein
VIEFLRVLPESSLLQSGLLAGLLAAIACGATGPLIVRRHLVMLVGAIAHVAIGGVGAAVYARHRFPGTLGWLDPLHGALVAAVASALLLAVLRRRAGDRLDMLVGAVWAVGMGIGLMLARLAPGASGELSSALFGNLAAVDRASLGLSAIIVVILLLAIGLLGRMLLATTVDPEFARSRGMHVDVLDALVLVLVALAVVVLVRVTGLLLVLALLTLPAATAGRFASRLWPMSLLATGLAAAVATVPRMAVYGTPLTPEAAIVLASAAVYLLVVVATRTRPSAADAIDA